MREEYRGSGVSRALIVELARIAAIEVSYLVNVVPILSVVPTFEQNCVHMEWIAPKVSCLEG